MREIEGYQVKRLMNIREVREAKKIMLSASELQINLMSDKEVSDEAINQIADIVRTSEMSDQLVTDVIAGCLGLTQEKLEEIEYPKAARIYGYLYAESTIIKKKLPQQSVSPIIPTT